MNKQLSVKMIVIADCSIQLLIIYQVHLIDLGKIPHKCLLVENTPFQMVAEILRKIGVPVKAVFDMDFLSDCTLGKSAVEAFGGNWDELSPLWNRIDSEVRKGIKSKNAKEIKDEIIKLLNKNNEDGSVAKTRF